MLDSARSANSFRVSAETAALLALHDGGGVDVQREAALTAEAAQPGQPLEAQPVLGVSDRVLESPSIEYIIRIRNTYTYYVYIYYILIGLLVSGAFPAFDPLEDYTTEFRGEIWTIPFHLAASGPRINCGGFSGLMLTLSPPVGFIPGCCSPENQ